MEAQQQEEPQQQNSTEQQAAAAAAEKKARRKRSRWGAETEAGLQVLAGADVVEQQQQQQQPAEQQQSAEAAAASAGTDAGADADAEAGRKKRRSRWGPETENKPGVLQGLQIALPPSIAALVDMHVDPKVMELQRQLNNVRHMGAHMGARCRREHSATDQRCHAFL